MYGYFERSSRNRSHIIRGNPDLEPEESGTAEAALGYRGNKFSIEGVYHFSKLENLIASHTVNITTDPVSHAQTVENEYENINKAEISGVEVSVTARPTDFWRLSASGEYLDKRDEETDKRLTDHARKTLKLGSSLFLGDFGFHTYYRGFFDYHGVDPNMPRGSAPVDSNFELVDIKLDYQLSPHHEIAFGIDNLLDKESPANYTRGGSPLDPGERYYYLSYTAKF
jgi:outer membrane receptor protein involved in Fe transport